MQFSDNSHNLRIELDTKNCRLSQPELEKMERALDPLRDPVRDFPVSDLYITVIHHHTPDEYHVRSALVLTGRTLFTGDRDAQPLTAWSRCVRKLVSKLTAYKEDLEAKPERTRRQEGKAHEVLPTQEPDAAWIDQAVERGDYAAFREATLVYEEPVRKRAGRWIERYPEAAAELGRSFTLADLVEEVFLNAFEGYADRPDAVPFGQWLEDLIDPSLKAVWRDPAHEKEVLSAVRTYRDAAAEHRGQDGSAES